LHDVEHGFVLKHGAVAAMPQKTEPGFDDQPIAGHAAIGADAAGGCDMTVQWAQLGAALVGQQFDQHALAQQGFEFQMGIEAEGIKLKFEAGDAGHLAADAFNALQGFGQQHVGAQWCVQAQQAVGLLKAAEPRRDSSGGQ
jgi:hypothetical protein